MLHRRSPVRARMRAYVCTPAVLTSTRPSLHDNLYNAIIGGYVSTAGGLAGKRKCRNRDRHGDRFMDRICRLGTDSR